MAQPDSFSPPLLSLDSFVPLSEELNLSPAPPSDRKAAEGLPSPVRGSPAGLEPEELLALAVVQQAADDWRAARSLLLRLPDHAGAAYLKRDTERFFRSRWFRVLVDLDGPAFLDRLRREDPPARRIAAGEDGTARRRF